VGSVLDYCSGIMWNVVVVPEKIYILASYKQNINDNGEKAFHCSKQ
jgi:hypothetical protein